MRASSSSPIWLVVFVLGPGPAAAQNILVNPGFATSVAGWKPESGVSAGWSPLDIAGAAASGSALVTNSVERRGILRRADAVRRRRSRRHLRVSRALSGPIGTGGHRASSGGSRLLLGRILRGERGRGIRKRHGGHYVRFRRVDRLRDRRGRHPRGRGERSRRPPAREGRRRRDRPGHVRRALAGARRDADDYRLGVAPRAERNVFQTDLWVSAARRSSTPPSPHVPAAFAFQTCGAASQPFQVHPRQSVYFTDALVTLFGDPGTARAIELSYDTSTTITVLSRTSSPSLPSPTAGTCGFNAHLGRGARARAVLVGLGSAAATRPRASVRTWASTPGPFGRVGDRHAARKLGNGAGSSDPAHSGGERGPPGERHLFRRGSGLDLVEKRLRSSRPAPPFSATTPSSTTDPRTPCSSRRRTTGRERPDHGR